MPHYSQVSQSVFFFFFFNEKPGLQACPGPLAGRKTLHP